MKLLTILIDFDGVLHSYDSGWEGAVTISDPPNEDAIEWLQEMINHPEIEPIIWTSRVHVGENEDPHGGLEAEAAIRKWLYLHGLDLESVEAIQITDKKKPAVMLIDDRAFAFSGLFPSVETIKEFLPGARVTLDDEDVDDEVVEDTPMTGVDSPIPGGDYP